MAERKISDDLLWGVEQIAREIGLSPRVTYWRLENGLLPCGNHGNIWVGSKSTLDQFFKDLTNKLPAPAGHILKSKAKKARTKKTASA